VLHPKADELCNILVRFLFECSDEIVQIETATAASLKHVAEGGAEDWLAVTILKAVKK
jgi:hypothetical protein